MLLIVQIVESELRLLQYNSIEWISPAQAWPTGPGLAQARRPKPVTGLEQARPSWKFGNLEILEFGNLGICNPKNIKKLESQNQNVFCPKCWQGLDL